MVKALSCTRVGRTSCHASALVGVRACARACVRMPSRAQPCACALLRAQETASEARVVAGAESLVAQLVFSAELGEARGGQDGGSRERDMSRQRARLHCPRTGSHERRAHSHSLARVCSHAPARVRLHALARERLFTFAGCGHALLVLRMCAADTSRAWLCTHVRITRTLLQA
eukprot:538410-Pleurochrysis_carterae.AAC.2